MQRRQFSHHLSLTSCPAVLTRERLSEGRISSEALSITSTILVNNQLADSHGHSLHARCQVGAFDKAGVLAGLGRNLSRIFRGIRAYPLQWWAFIHGPFAVLHEHCTQTKPSCRHQRAAFPSQQTPKTNVSDKSKLPESACLASAHLPEGQPSKVKTADRFFIGSLTPRFVRHATTAGRRRGR